jgi:nucleoside-diphosphate-sugar epimerase
MKTLVTGATGFVGGALTHRLHHMGWDVTALGRNPVKLNALEDDGIRAVRADISKKDEVTASFSNVELVFHCAALPSPWGSFEKFYQANVIGTRNIVRACLENNVERLVYISTPSIYFDYDSRIGVKENDPLPEPITHYAATKRLAEEEIDKGFAQGLAVVSKKSANGLVIRSLGMQDYSLSRQSINMRT